MQRTKDIDLIIETMILLQGEARRLAREECQRFGITGTQLNILKMLEEIGELSLSELSRRVVAHNSTMTGIVDRMVQGGLVSREQSASDRRVWRIRLTDKGRKVAASVTVAPWDLLRGAFEALKPREKGALLAILNKMAAHVSSRVEGEKNGARR